jgi:CHAD domain-containing protein
MSAAAPAPLEVKLEFSEGAAPSPQHPVLEAAHPGPAEILHLNTTYFDTASLDFWAHGMTLLVQESDGDYVQILRPIRAVAGFGTPPSGWEWYVDTAEPELLLLKEAGTDLHFAVIGPLQPVFSTRVVRTVRDLLPEAGTTVQMVADEGDIDIGNQQESLREWRLVLKNGPPAPLYALALALLADLPARLNVECTALRGYRLLTGKTAQSRKAKTVKLAPELPTADAFRQIVLGAIADLLENQSAAAAGDAEGVHQMRVAVRYLRTALALFEPFLEPHVVGGFVSALRELGRTLGAARDWDVFCTEALTLAFEESPVHYKYLLEQAAASRRAEAYRAAIAEFEGKRVSGLVLGLSAWIFDDEQLCRHAGMRQSLQHVAPDFLDRLARKSTKRGRHLARREVVELHALRKSIKKLRYGAAYFSGLYPQDKARPCLKACKRLQNILGKFNDANTATALAEALHSDNQNELIPVAGALSAWSSGRRAEALHALPRAWKKFKRRAPFWS